MINLLPKGPKKQIRAARMNVLLIRYTTLVAIAVVVMLVSAGSVYFVMQTIASSADERAQENRSQIANYDSVQSEANEFRNNLNTAKQILDSEIIYSDTVIKIARTIPPGVVLSSLELTPQSFGGPMTLNASARSYDHAVRLKNSLEKSDMFSNVRISTVGGSTDESGYPVSVSLAATMTAEKAAR